MQGKIEKISKPKLKNKIKGLINSGGRNNSGKITINHKGGGHKKRYRKIDFFRNTNANQIVFGIEYDPNRNCFIASAFDILTKESSYIIAPKNLKVGDIIKSGTNIDPKLGYSIPIAQIPVGSLIHCVSDQKNSFGKISRAAGTFSILKEKNFSFIKIKTSAGKQKLVKPDCFASIGVVSNDLRFFTKRKKAGESRWANIRPSVRGVAMNPVDHPHGGGEGKKSGKGKTPWGKPVKGKIQK